MASLFPAPQQYFDNNGDPLAGGKVYFYEAGTTTPKDTFTDQTGGVANANPVILDSAGRASIWGTGSYKEVVKTSADVTISTKDAVTLGSEINDGTVTNAMLADMAANTVKARVASTSGVPSDLALSASTLLGRGSTGNLSEITLSGGLSMSGTVLSSSSVTSVGHRSGVYYPCAHVIQKVYAISLFTPVTNRLYAVPFRVGKDTTFTGLDIKVTTAEAAKNFRIGIYNDSAGVPTTLVSDFGAGSLASTGLIDVSGSQALTAGAYWLAFVTNSSSAVVQGGDYDYVDETIMGVNSTQQPFTHLYVAHTYGALPSSFGTATAVANAITPIVWAKV